MKRLFVIKILLLLPIVSLRSIKRTIALHCFVISNPDCAFRQCSPYSVTDVIGSGSLLSSPKLSCHQYVPPCFRSSQPWSHSESIRVFSLFHGQTHFFFFMRSGKEAKTSLPDRLRRDTSPYYVWGSRHSVPRNRQPGNLHIWFDYNSRRVSADFPRLDTTEATGCEGTESEILETLTLVGRDKPLELDGLLYELHSRQSSVFVPLLELIYSN